ncbi:sensor histidine kinase [Sediminispirochaeta bajacaliforniensis]|uniref:sensor histidine kinase n=1 Tax=Sediminispirochaeta bajacaliforniensis TaxID=148 RepID=UPI0012B57209|nr:HAMP domain-containing sensor histidine kinase [Sediminispirochaeta bajacaliforniensis]
MRNKRIGRIRSGLLIASIVVMLSVIGTLQHRWFKRAAVGELARSYRSIYTLVIRTAAREFQRFNPLFDALQSEHGAIEATVEKQWLLYGPKGAVVELFDSISWLDTAAPQELHSYQGPEAGWSLIHDPLFVASLPFSVSGDILKEGMAFDDYQGNSWFVMPGNEKGRLVMIRFNNDAFFSKHVEPAIALALPEFRISWMDFEEMRKRNLPFKFNWGWDDRISFRPFESLLGFSKAPREIGIFVPLVYDREDQHPDPGPGRFAVIESLNGPVTGDLEYTLAMNWFLGMLLLAGVGGGFIVLVLQMKRLSLLRSQEREFVASISHELRTPLSVIRSAADNLSSGIVPPERFDTYCSLISGQVDRLGGMIEEVLLYSGMESRLAAGRRQNSERPLLFAPFFQELEHELSQLASEYGKNLELRSSGLPRGAVTDSEALAMIIRNLVINAVYHAWKREEEGTVIVTARLQVPRSLVFTVEDDGRGIEPKEQRRIFDPFYRDKISREAQEQGSGLGLFLASKRALLLGGTLRVESPRILIDGRKASGTKFVLVIPWVPYEEEEDEQHFNH